MTITIPRALLESVRTRIESSILCDVTSLAAQTEAQRLLDETLALINAELAKPATAPKASTFIRERAQLEQEWCVLKGTQQQYKNLPAWHDAPTEPGWWVCREATTGNMQAFVVTDPDALNRNLDIDGRWYGPIPEDKQ